MLRVGQRSNRESSGSARLAERLPKPDFANFDAMARCSKNPAIPVPLRCSVFSTTGNQFYCVSIACPNTPFQPTNSVSGRIAVESG